MKKLGIYIFKSYPVLMVLLVLQFVGCVSNKNPELVDYVDNFIGVRDVHSSCVIGPQLPNACINPSPHTPGGANK